MKSFAAAALAANAFAQNLFLQAEESSSIFRPTSDVEQDNSVIDVLKIIADWETANF